MPPSKPAESGILAAQGKHSSHVHARPVMEPLSALRTLGALAVLLTIALTVLVTSRVAGLVRAIVLVEPSAGQAALRDRVAGPNSTLSRAQGAP